MAILVTGGCGFIGAYVANMYHEMGDQVIVVDDLRYSSDRSRLRGPELHVLDVGDYQAITRLLVDHRVRTVIHMAAQTHVDKSFDHVPDFIQDNIAATTALLQACRDYGRLDKFVHMSTDEVYGDVSNDHPGCTEAFALAPTNPYAATKASAEHMCCAFLKSYQLPVVIVRCNNVYGAMQNPEKLIPKVTKHLVNDEIVPIHGDGEMLRSFVHARDVAAALRCVAEKGVAGEAYNIGSANEISVNHVVERVLSIVKPGARFEDWCSYVKDRPYNDKRYAVDDSKLRALGWSEKCAFSETFETEVREYVRVFSGKLRWLLFGGKGWIGQQAAALLQNDGHAVIIAESRADDDDASRSELLKHRPDRVFSFVGRTHGGGCPTIDYLEHPDRLHQNLLDNLYAPVQLAMQCAALDIHFSYLGTGCIFSYNIDTPDAGYSEASRPDFFGSNYSIVKGITDRLMHHSSALNIRIRMPIVGYDHPRNFITKIASYSKVVNIPNSMTVLPELLPVAIDMAKRKLTGTMNLTNHGAITHNEILSLYRTHVDPSFVWYNFSESEQNEILKSKRSNNLLDTERLRSEYPCVKSIHDSVKDLFLNWKAS